MVLASFGSKMLPDRFPKKQSFGAKAMEGTEWRVAYAGAMDVGFIIQDPWEPFYRTPLIWGFFGPLQDSLRNKIKDSGCYRPVLRNFLERCQKLDNKDFGVSKPVQTKNVFFGTATGYGNV